MPNFTPLEIVPAEKLGLPPEDYVPELQGTVTNPTLGSDGEAEGWYSVSQSMVFGGARFTFNGTDIDAGEGFYRITLPLPVDSTYVNTSGTLSQGHTIGIGRIRRNSPSSDSRIVVVQPTTPLLVLLALPWTSASVSAVQPASGWVAAGSRISLDFCYPAIL